MRLRERLLHLSPKTVSWLQGARPLDVTHRIQRPHDKREAAKKSCGREKLHLRYLVKTAHRPQRRSADLVKTKLHLQGGPR